MDTETAIERGLVPKPTPATHAEVREALANLVSVMNCGGEYSEGGCDQNTEVAFAYKDACDILARG